MKCLSIRQPWALLVCIGARTIENRSWDTSHRGEIAIHAGGYRNAVKHFMELSAWDETINDTLSFGAIIGVAELYETRRFDERNWGDPCAEGPFCHLFRNARLFQTHSHTRGVSTCANCPWGGVAMRVEELKADCVDADANELRQKCVHAIPHGPVAKMFLPREPRWHSS